MQRGSFNTFREAECDVRTKQGEEGERGISGGHLSSEPNEAPAPVPTSRRPREVFKEPLTPNEALNHLTELESDADNRLAVLGDQMGEALTEVDFGRLFMLERAFEQTWKRRERIRNTWRCAQEALDDTAA